MTHIAYSSGLSDCCQAEMIIVSGDDFGHRDGTMHYECTECGEACDIYTGKDKRKKKYGSKRTRRTFEK